MKKFLSVAAIVALCLSAHAQIDQVTFTHSGLIGTNQSAVSRTVAGEVLGVIIDNPGAAYTGTVSIVSAAGQTVFSKAGIAADASYAVRVPLATTAGAAPTTVDAGAITNSLYVPLPVYGVLTSTLTGQTASTNQVTWTVKLIVRK